MLFGDNVYFGNTAVDAAYLGNTQVWSAIPADVKAHIARVTADGGTVPEQAKMVSMVKKLIAANLWDSCVFFGLPLGGVKKDGINNVSKVYDLKANADMLQGTGTAQPKYDNGSLLYDGGDKLQSGVLGSTNLIRTITNKITVVCWANIPAGAEQAIFCRWQTGAIPSLCHWLAEKESANKFQVAISNGTTAPVKRFTSSENISGTYKQLAFTFDGGAMDGAVQGVLKMYINGNLISPTKSQNSSISNMHDSNQPVTIGAIGNSLIPIANTGKTALSQVYNSVLSDSQMLWNFNNIRPEGV